MLFSVYKNRQKNRSEKNGNSSMRLKHNVILTKTAAIHDTRQKDATQAAKTFEIILVWREINFVTNCCI